MNGILLNYHPSAKISCVNKKKFSALFLGLALCLIAASSDNPANAQTQPIPTKSAQPNINETATTQNQTIDLENGVPFPSMLRAENGSNNKFPIPPAGQPMSIRNPQITKDMNALNQEVDSRLSDLSLGDGKMSPPDLSPYADELSAMSEEERQIRLLKLKQERATLAIKLWETLYDPEREGGARKQVLIESDESSKKQAAAPPPPPPPPQAPSPPQSSFGKDFIPLPKIVEISGTSGALNATLLVPYVGEMHVKNGAGLPGGRKITSITSEGVIISDPQMGEMPLGYGDSVPLAPPTQAATVGPQQRGPMMNLPQPPTPPPFPATFMGK